jgi:hypothetical protein
MLTELQAQPTDALDSNFSILHNSDAPPVAIPSGHVGPVYLPGSGRLIYWTGRVAIGLRHQPQREFEAIGQSALWLQDLMLAKDERLAA